MATIYFDMDGTLAALFFVKGYADMLANKDTTPYTIANPLYDVSEMATTIRNLTAHGYTIGIISYVDDTMIEQATRAKVEWLNRYFPYVNSENIHIVTKATPKSAFYKNGDILVDDAKANREDWESVGGKTINAYFRAKVSMLESLKSLVTGC